MRDDLIHAPESFAETLEEEESESASEARRNDGDAFMIGLLLC